MSKPVTELYEAAKAQWLGEDSGERLDKALSEIEKLDPTNDRVLLRLLDLVATLPPERLGLVRWVVGLSTDGVRTLVYALHDYQRRVESAGDAESRATVDAVVDGFDSALSGGGCGAKEEPNHKDEIRALETRLAEVRAKIQCGDRPSSPPVVLLREEDDLRTRLYMLRAAQHTAKPKPTILPAGKPADHTSACVEWCACKESSDASGSATDKPDCLSCSWGMPMYDAQWRVLPGRTWCRHQYEYDRVLGLAAQAQKTEKRILPAGKPPPFLRMGMVLRRAEDHASTGAIWTILKVERKEVVARCGVIARWLIAQFDGWVLAEPFTVEGES